MANCWCTLKPIKPRESGKINGSAVSKMVIQTISAGLLSSNARQSNPHWGPSMQKPNAADWKEIRKFQNIDNITSISLRKLKLLACFLTEIQVVHHRRKKGKVWGGFVGFFFISNFELVQILEWAFHETSRVLHVNNGRKKQT